MVIQQKCGYFAAGRYFSESTGISDVDISRGIGCNGSREAKTCHARRTIDVASLARHSGERAHDSLWSDLADRVIVHIGNQNIAEIVENETGGRVEASRDAEPVIKAIKAAARQDRADSVGRYFI